MATSKQNQPFQNEKPSAHKPVRLYPDLTALIGSLATSTLKPEKISRSEPPTFVADDCASIPLEPSAPPEELLTQSSVEREHNDYMADRNKTDLHNWSRWRSQLNQEFSDYFQGNRQDVGFRESFRTIPDGSIKAIYNHAITKDNPSTCLSSLPYLMFGIPRVKRARCLARKDLSSVRVH